MDTMDGLIDPILDGALWRRLLAGDAGPLAALVPGARIAVIPQPYARREAGCLLMCEAQPGGMASRIARFAGFQRCDADIAFVINDEARASLVDEAGHDGLGALRRLVRRGHVVLYFLKCEGALIELGFEEFLESLGLNVLGACR